MFQFNLKPLLKEEDGRKYIASLALVEDYLLYNRFRPKLFLKGLFNLALKVLSVILSYMPPYILTQMDESPSKILLLILATQVNKIVAILQEQINTEHRILFNAYYSQQLFQHCLDHQTQTTFSGILRELSQIEKAINSFNSLVIISVELSFVYYLLKIDVVLESIKFGMLISLLALGAASVAQIYAWRWKHFSDRRLKMIQSILSGIKSIKYLQWETVFLQLVDATRIPEFQANQGIQYVDTFISFFRRMTQIVLLFVAFYKLRDLEPSSFYTLLICFDKLTGPINSFPWCFGEFLGSFFSIIRLNDFFKNKSTLKEFKEGKIIVSDLKQKWFFDKAIEVIQGSSAQKLIHHSFELKISFDQLPQNKLICIVGSVGSGKTLLLDHLCDGAYVSQNPWLYSGTVRDNILFGAEFDEKRYLQSLRRAAIDFDDNKQVGLNGTNLSGGQRQRVAFCRAIYSERDAYFFDDVFSSVDENIADVMFKSLRELTKTVVIVLNQKQYLPYADYVVEVENGEARLVKSQNCEVQQIQFNPGQIMESYEPLPPEKEIDIETEQNILENYTFYLKAIGLFALSNFIIFTLGHQGAKLGFELWIYSNLRSLSQLDKQWLTMIFLLLTAVTFLRGFFFSYASLVSARKIYYQLMQKFIYLPTIYFDNFSPRFYIRRLFDEMQKIDDLALNHFFSVIMDSIGFLVLVMTVQFEILLYSAIAAYFFITQVKKYREFRVSYQIQVNKFYPSQELDSFIVEIEKGTKTIKSFKKYDFVLQKFKKILLQGYATSLTQLQINRVQGFVNFMVHQIAFYTLLLTSSNIMTYAYAYLFFNRELISATIDSWSTIVGLSQTLNRILQVIRFPSEQNKQQLAFQDERIVFQDVWLSYGIAKGMQNADYALKGASFDVKKGEKVAFCGRTGSGKSSLFNLLVRLYEYQKGEIKFYGNSIKDYGIQQLRSMMSVIPQQGIIIGGSIRNNIDPQRLYSDERIKKLMEDLGIELKLDKQSENLSNGEKQLISFVQSILLEKEIILMDEATSNMDSETNNRIMAALFKLVRNKTLLLISHRLENLQNFDRIYVMSGGQVVESGSYEQLTTGNTKFNELRTKL